MTGFRALAKRLALALSALAAGVAAYAATPEGDGWVADPDSQYLLDLNVHQLRLGENLRAYPTPEGTCLNMGDLLGLLDTPITIDNATGTAKGWAFRQDLTIEIDRNKRKVVRAGAPETLHEGDIRDTPEGWCVDSAAAGRWLGIDLVVTAGASSVRIESKTKLPVEMARERLNRARFLKKAALPLESGPAIKIPYRMWRAPALDFVVDAGVTYSATGGTRIDRRVAVTAAGEIGGLSYNSQIIAGQRKLVDSLRFRAYRSDPEGNLLGPLHATHFAFGDVGGLSHPLLGGAQGRGVELTNQPLFNPHSFSKTRFEGALQPGWQAELYRNGQLLDFSTDDGSGLYKFEDVDLRVGDNQFEILLYGPQGQKDSRFETIRVGADQLPPGETRWWFGANQPGRDILGVSPKPVDQDVDAVFDGKTVTPKAQAAFQVEHGIDKRTSVAALAAAMLVGDERLTFVEGSVRRSIGPALLEGGVAYQAGGGLALRGQALAQIGKINLSAEAAKLNHFYYEGRLEEKASNVRLTADAPFSLGKVPMAAHVEYRMVDRTDDKRERAEARLTGAFGRVQAGAALGWNRDTSKTGVTDSRFDLKTMTSGRIGQVRIRGAALWDIAPEAGLHSADVSAYWSAGENVDWEFGAGYDRVAGRTTARVSHIRRFDSLAVAATLEAASDKSFAAGINVNFSLDANKAGFHPVRSPLAQTGQVRATVFRDDNNNGVRDPGEKTEDGVQLTGGVGATSEPSGKNGVARLSGLTPYQAVSIGIDGSTLSDPSLAPRKASQIVIPRPGVTADLAIALVGAGDVEAILVGNDGNGIEGVDIEALDEDGKVVGTARTDFDGFFLFERLAYGHYSFRIAADSAKALNLSSALGARVELDPDHSLVRLGPVPVTRASVSIAAR